MLSPSEFPLGTMGCEGWEQSVECGAAEAAVRGAASAAADALRPLTRFELKASEKAPSTPPPVPTALGCAVEFCVERPQEPVAAEPLVVCEALISS